MLSIAAPILLLQLNPIKAALYLAGELACRGSPRLGKLAG
jgi:hypothetical protein